MGVPLVDAASITNYVGYVTWCLWLLAWPPAAEERRHTAPYRPSSPVAARP
jgi:hypothetical protein